MALAAAPGRDGFDYNPRMFDPVTALRIASVALMLQVGLSAQAGTDAERWPDYRGPGWNGHADEAEAPIEWSESKNVRWKTAIRGVGWASPVVWGRQVWVTSADESGHRLYAVAVDLDSGEVVHDLLVFEVDEPEPKNELNSFASPSPVIEDGRVYVHFGTYGTACLDTASGQKLWERRDLNCDHKEGPGSSPVLYRDKLIFNVDGADVQYVIALDKQTGETRWKTPRDAGLEELRPDLRKAYSTPIIVEDEGAPQLLSSGAEATVAYDPDTGEELWRVRYRGFSMSARPITDGELVFLNTGFPKPNLLAVRLGGAGDVTDSGVAWRYRRGVPQMSSALHADGRIFFVSDGGIVTCLRSEDGRRLWRQRIGGRHCGSPVVVAGRVYFFDRDGRSVVLEAAESYVKLGENQLGEGFMACPAVVSDGFILRGTEHLYRIGER